MLSAVHGEGIGRLGKLNWINDATSDRSIAQVIKNVQRNYGA